MGPGWETKIQHWDILLLKNKIKSRTFFEFTIEQSFYFLINLYQLIHQNAIYFFY